MSRGRGGHGGGGRGRLYTYRYTVTTRMTPALRWAAVRAILVFINCEGQSHQTVFTEQPCKLGTVFVRDGGTLLLDLTLYPDCLW